MSYRANLDSRCRRSHLEPVNLLALGPLTLAYPLLLIAAVRFWRLGVSFPSHAALRAALWSSLLAAHTALWAARLIGPSAPWPLDRLDALLLVSAAGVLGGAYLVVLGTSPRLRTPLTEALPLGLLAGVLALVAVRWAVAAEVVLWGAGLGAVGFLYRGIPASVPLRRLNWDLWLYPGLLVLALAVADRWGPRFPEALRGLSGSLLLTLVGWFLVRWESAWRTCPVLTPGTGLRRAFRREFGLSVREFQLLNARLRGWTFARAARSAGVSVPKARALFRRALAQLGLKRFEELRDLASAH